MNGKNRTARALLALLAGAALLGCSNTDGGEQRDDDAAGERMDASGADPRPAVDAGTPDGGEQNTAAYATACEIPQPAADRSSCRTDRRLLECELPGGALMTCLGEACMGQPDFRADRCRDLCKPDEYAAGCGGIGPSAPSNDPPDPACGDGSFTPGGSAFYCCPCR